MSEDDLVPHDIRIVILHSGRLFRETLAMTLSQQEGIAVSSEVSSLDQIRADGVECQPDLFLVEASVPLCRCLEQVRGLQAIVPACKTIILGVPDTDEAVLACIEVGGASGYVLDNGSFDEVVRNIRAVVAGESICSLGWPTLPSQDYRPWHDALIHHGSISRSISHVVKKKLSSPSREV